MTNPSQRLIDGARERLFEEAREWADDCRDPAPVFYCPIELQLRTAMAALVSALEAPSNEVVAEAFAIVEEARIQLLDAVLKQGYFEPDVPIEHAVLGEEKYWDVFRQECCPGRGRRRVENLGDPQ